MKFDLSCSLEYAVGSPLTMILGIRAAKTMWQHVENENLVTDPGVPLEPIGEGTDGNRLERIHLEQGEVLRISYSATVDRRMELLAPEDLRRVAPRHLVPGVVPYLFPSRYCQSDRLMRLAWQEFGSIQGAYDQVDAVAAWIHRTIEYLPGATDSATSAYDTVTERAGVCRDFAHLGIALCRALNIPARYVSAYAHGLNPPDFHACFEAYIGGWWVVFDATRLAPLNGLVRIGTGRDAADISVTTAFGQARPLFQEVVCRAQDGCFQPMVPGDAGAAAVSFQEKWDETGGGS